MASQDQNPIGSGFGRSTTAGEVVAGLDLEGRNYIVAGGHSGIGPETVRALVEPGAGSPCRRIVSDPTPGLDDRGSSRPDFR